MWFVYWGQYKQLMMGLAFGGRSGLIGLGYNFLVPVWYQGRPLAPFSSFNRFILVW